LHRIGREIREISRKILRRREKYRQKNEKNAKKCNEKYSFFSEKQANPNVWSTCSVYERRSKNSCPLHSSAGQMYRPARAQGRWALALPL
jgi:hypothetical protein